MLRFPFHLELPVQGEGDIVNFTVYDQVKLVYLQAVDFEVIDLKADNLERILSKVTELVINDQK